MQVAKFNLADKVKITENVFNDNTNEKDWNRSTVMYKFHNVVADKLRVGLELMLFWHMCN